MSGNDGDAFTDAGVDESTTPSQTQAQPEAKKKKVVFAESTHPEDQAYRKADLFHRPNKTYIPGKHAEPSGAGWMNTSGFGKPDPWRPEHLEVRERNSITYVFAPQSFLCSKCFAPFPTAGDLEFHMQTAHAETLSCIECGEVFPTSHELTSHMQVAHPEFEDDADDNVMNYI